MNFHRYRTVGTLQEYILIAQDVVRIERYRRQDHGEWLYSVITVPDAAVDLASLATILTFGEAQVQSAPGLTHICGTLLFPF